MRVERRGPVAKLTPRLERFFVEALRGESLDATQSPGERKADYRCLNGLLVIELKTLEEDASERIENLTDELRKRPDWPIFLGSAPIDSIIRHLSQPDGVERQLIERIGRAIKSHMRKANKQLAAHEASFPRKNVTKVMVLVNEDHEIYDPELISYIVHHLLLRHESGEPLYPNIDAVLFLSERHVVTTGHQVSFPVVCLEGVSIENAEWKRDVTDLFLKRWAEWNGSVLHYSDLREQMFATIDHIPDQMKRYEYWELEYKRNPYMRSFTDEQLRERFDEVMCVATLAFLKNSPFKPERPTVVWSMSSMSHVMLEMGWRSIPVTQFKSVPGRLAAAAVRIRLPAYVIEWFKSDMPSPD